MGSINLDHAGSGGAITLSSDGTSLLLGGSAIGGGGASTFVENYSSGTLPLAAGTNGISIGIMSSASGPNSFAVGRQAVASGTYSFAGGGFCTASGTGSAALAGSGLASSAVTASGSWSTAIGINSQAYGAVAAGTGSVAIGGSYSSGTDSFAAGISNNTSSYGATGANSGAMGYQAKASSNYDTAIGYKAIASGYGSLAIGTAGSSASGPTASGPGTIAIGNDVQATTHYCFGIGTDINVSHQYSYAIGDKLVARAKGQFVYGTGRFAADGDAQGSQYIIKCATTDATPTTMVTDGGSSGSSDNQIVAVSDTCLMFSGTIVAMQNGAQDQGGWQISGLLKNDGGTTTLVNSEVKTFADGNGWSIVLSADNTNNALKVQCTGEASHNIRWVANIQTSEVTYT
jgi:hypothetical protein